MKEQLFDALQRFYPGSDEDWDYDEKNQRLIAKPGRLRQMADGKIQAITYHPDEPFEWNRFQRSYVHVSELPDFQRWVYEAMSNNEGMVDKLRSTWAEIG